MLYNTDTIKNYYSSLKSDLPIDFLKFKHFRIVTADGSFMKVKERIKNPTSLWNLLANTAPIDVYYSVGYFMNPTKVGIRGKDHSKFFKMDLVFDIDDKDNLKRAFAETRRIYDYGIEQGWKLKYCAFSGAKGFHLVFNDPFVYDYSQDLEEQAENKRRDLVRAMSEFNFDSPVTIDTRRIIRVPYTLNSKTGMACTLITEPLLKKNNFKQMMQDVYRVNIRLGLFARLRSLFQGNDLQKKFFADYMKKLRFPRNRKRLRSGEHFYSVSVSNRVLGTKMFVPILRYSSYKNALRDLEHLSATYGLGLMHLFYIGGNYFALSLKPIQKERFEKILGNSKCTNFATFKKRGIAYMEIGPRQFSKRIEPLSYIGNWGTDQKTKLSLGHLSLLRKYVMPKHLEKNLLVGKNKVEFSYFSAKLEFF